MLSVKTEEPVETIDVALNLEAELETTTQTFWSKPDPLFGVAHTGYSGYKILSLRAINLHEVDVGEVDAEEMTVKIGNIKFAVMGIETKVGHP